MREIGKKQPQSCGPSGVSEMVSVKVLTMRSFISHFAGKLWVMSYFPPAMLIRRYFLSSLPEKTKWEVGASASLSSQEGGQFSQTFRSSPLFQTEEELWARSRVTKNHCCDETEGSQCSFFCCPTAMLLGF